MLCRNSPCCVSIVAKMEKPCINHMKNKLNTTTKLLCAIVSAAAITVASRADYVPDAICAEDNPNSGTDPDTCVTESEYEYGFQCDFTPCMFRLSPAWQDYCVHCTPPPPETSCGGCEGWYVATTFYVGTCQSLGGCQCDYDPTIEHANEQLACATR